MHLSSLSSLEAIWWGSEISSSSFRCCSHFLPCLLIIMSWHFPGWKRIKYYLQNYLYKYWIYYWRDFLSHYLLYYGCVWNRIILAVTFRPCLLQTEFIFRIIICHSIFYREARVSLSYLSFIFIINYYKRFFCLLFYSYLSIL